MISLSPVDDQPITRELDALPIKTGDVTTTELGEAIKSTQGDKATGLDGVSAEVWKLECFNVQILEVSNKAYHGDIPGTWLNVANLGSVSNYRDITLMAVGAKIYNTMLLDKLRPHIDAKLRNNQNGSRKGRCTHVLMPIVPSGAEAINDPPPSHSVLGCSCHTGPVGPLLFQLCFSVSPPNVARPASLPLRLRQVLKNVWIICCIVCVVRHVSHP